MIYPYWNDKMYDVKKFERDHPKLELIYEDPGLNHDLIYRDVDGQIYAKGDYARWDATCYCPLGTPTMEEIKEWVSRGYPPAGRSA